MNHEKNNNRKDSEPATPLKEKVRMAGEQTLEKLHDLSGKMEGISGKIKEMPIPNLTGEPVMGATDGAAFDSYKESIHPSDARGSSGLHPSSGRGPSGMHPSEQRELNRWNAGTTQMNAAGGLSRIPERENRPTQRMREDAEHLKERMPEVAERLSRRMDEHIEGKPMREENAEPERG